MLRGESRSFPDYSRAKALCKEFLQFHTEDGNEREPYMKQLADIWRRDSRLLKINLDDVAKASSEISGAVDAIEGNSKRFQAIFSAAADEILKDTQLFPPAQLGSIHQDVFDVLLSQREEQMQQAKEQQDRGAGDTEVDPNSGLPPELMRRYTVVFLPRSNQKPIKLREVMSEHCGCLVTVQGIVTNMTDVKPQLSVATYIDKESGNEIYQVITGKTFTPLTELPEPLKSRSQSRQAPTFQTHGSKFLQYQEIKIQEMACEVPQGSTPRSIVVQLKEAMTRTCKPGDAVSISGIFLAEPLTGFGATRPALRDGFLTNTYLEAMHVMQLKQSYQQHALDEALQTRMHEVCGATNAYELLAHSIAPEIFGHEDVKKALLLLMVGGVSKHMHDGMKLRGDVHMCLMGDPGVAKSQLIKHIAHISPRAVYTTGKGSSGVGLTASVQRDPVSKEVVLEGGALVLADKGICCIDEFDKMEEADRTAIHEVMEQQTVSIAKAGIMTTLNTRTALLAAANPAWGRYNARRSPAENINLPAALLSRFDLMWLILDKVDSEQDNKLANHVMNVHKDGKAPATEDGLELLSPELLRAYVATAKTFTPHLPAELGDFVAAVYADMRAKEKQSKVPHSYTTPRTLLSIMRLSQALAKLRFSDSICQADVDEALRLMRMSKISLYEGKENNSVEDPITAVYTAIRDNSVLTGRRVYTWAELVALLGHRHSNDVIRAAVEEYGDYNVFNLENQDTNEPTVHILEAP